MATTFEQYENLPGVKVSYEDGNLATENQVANSATQSILIVGTAIDGPVGEPVSVNAIGGPKAAEKLFGGMLTRQKIEQNGEVLTIKAPHQGTLLRAMWEAIRAGNEDVRLLRVAGKTAKTELPAKDPNSEVTQPLADTVGNNLLPGNVAFSKALGLSSNLRLVNIEKVEEFAGTDTTGVPEKTYSGSTGYASVDTTVGSETIYFGADKFRPKNTIKVTYKAKERSYNEVTRSMNGIDNPSTLGLLTQDPTNTNYFSAEVGNWSDDPMHSVNVYVIDAAGNVNSIPSTNASGEFLYRIGKEDTKVVNELRDPTTETEFRQGGIRFTAAYQAEVAGGFYPALTSGVTVTVDYFYYNDLEVVGTLESIVPGKEKETFLNYLPESDSLEVYYEFNGLKTTLTEGEDYTIIFPSVSGEKTKVLVKAGVGPVGAKLFAYYKTGENSIGDVKLIVSARHPGALYGGIEDPKDDTTLYGVQVIVEYEKTVTGTIDMENRIIRFIKPMDKRTNSSDIEMRFSTKNLPGIRTLREFANYVNNLPNNNIVLLEVTTNAGDVPLKGLTVTDYSISPITGDYDYRPINLGERYDEATGKFALYVDDEKAENDPERYPWLGTDGFFDSVNLLSTKGLYETLGGKYELVQGTLDEYELVEQGVYSKLENYAVDIIWLAEVNANTAIGEFNEEGALVASRTKNFATQLAQHCAMVTAKTHETIGIVGVSASPNSTLREVQEYIDLLTGNLMLGEEKEEFYVKRGINPYYVNQHFMYNPATFDLIYNDEGDPIDIGRYVSVVFGPEVGLAHEKIGNYVTNGAGIYAALISTLNAEISTTNQQINVNGLRYTLSESQYNQLSGGRYVTFESKLQANGSRRIVVKDGLTGSLATSDYSRLSTVRIAHATVQLVRLAADRFIGLPNGLAQRNALATEIQSALDKLKEKGVLNDFKFSIYSSARDAVLGNAFITLELVPAYEIRKIYTSVALRSSL